MNNKIISELIETYLIPHIGDELHSQLRDIRNELERLTGNITEIGDKIDELARGECEDDDVADHP